MAQSFVIGLPRTVRRKRNAHCHNGMTALETCQYIEKMVSIVPYQFKPESDDETVEVADREEQEQDVSQW